MSNSRAAAAATHEKIVVHEHDVLNGRGVNIAQHPGNLRFRALVKSHADQSYCSDYSTSAKKALAEEIIHHIRNLNPPGRFLKRPPRVKKADVDSGPWEELSFRETLKKTCQALRDCNRGDRAEYARHIDTPKDVQASQINRQQSGLSNREYAERIAASAINRVAQPPTAMSLPAEVPSTNDGSGPLWLDTSAAAEPEEPDAVHSFTKTPKPMLTPATAASSGGFHGFIDNLNSSADHGDEEHIIGSGVQLPFGDNFTNSPNQPGPFDYAHLTLEEDQKLTAMAHDSVNFDNHLEADNHLEDSPHERELLGRHLDEGTDFTTVFDADLTI